MPNSSLLEYLEDILYASITIRSPRGHSYMLLPTLVLLESILHASVTILTSSEHSYMPLSSKLHLVAKTVRNVL